MSVNIGNAKYLSIHIKKQQNCLIVCLTNINILLQHVINKIINDILYYLCHNKSSKSISIVARFGHDVFSDKEKCTPIQTLKLFLTEACYPTSVFKFRFLF